MNDLIGQAMGSPATPTQTGVPSGSNFGGTDLIGGKTQPVTKPTIKTLPSFVGGGSFNMGAGNAPVLSPRDYAGMSPKTGSEREHIVPVSLGGTSEPSNLRYQSMDEASYKDNVEKYAAHQVRTGAMSASDARLMVGGWKNTDVPGQVAWDRKWGGSQTISGNFFQSLVENFPGTKQSISDIVKNPFSLPDARSLGKYGQELTDSTINTIKNAGEATLKSWGNLVDTFKKPTSVSEKVGAGATYAAKSAQLALSPISALFNNASKIPVFGTISKLLTLPFATAGDGGARAAHTIVDSLPISQESKNHLQDGFQEIGSLAAQFLLGIGEAKLLDPHPVAVEASKLTDPKATEVVKNTPVNKVDALVKDYSPEGAKTILEQAGNKFAGGVQEPKELQIGITNVTDKIPEIKALTDQANSLEQAGDFEGANKIHNQILDKGEGALKSLFADHPDIKIDVQRTKGNFFGNTEGTFATKVTVPSDKLNIVIQRFSELGDKGFAQHNVHISGVLTSLPDGATMGVERPDGFVYEPNIDFRFDRPLTDKEFSEISKELQDIGLAGSTLHPDQQGINLYNISKFKNYEEFNKQLEELANALDTRGIRATNARTIRNLLNIGEAEGGATRGYEDIRSQIRPQSQEKGITDLVKGIDKPPVEPQAGFVNPSQISKDVPKLVNKLLGILEPAKPVIRKFGGDVYAKVIKAIHLPEAETIAFDNKFSEVQKFFNTLSSKDLDNFNNARGTASSPEGIALQKDAVGSLDPKLKAIAPALKQVSDFVYDYAKKNGVDLEYFKDYFYGAYRDPEKVTNFLDYWKTTEKYTKEKTIPTIADASAFGLELRNKNPIGNIRDEMSAVVRKVGLKNLAEYITKTEPNYATTMDKATPDQRALWRPIEDPTFKGMLFEPDYAEFVNNLISTNKITRGGFLGGLRQVSMMAQQVKFFGSVFHMTNELKGAISAETGAFANPKGWGDFAKSFKGIDYAQPEYKEYVGLGGGHRYSLESQSLTQLSGFMKKMADAMSPAVGKAYEATKFIPASPEFTQWMFDKFIPSLKFNKFMEDVSAKADTLGRDLTDSEKIDIIKRNQNFYGEMNERLFGRSGTVTTALRLIFSAPGYGEGNFRTLTKALSGDKQSAKFITNTLVTSITAATIGTMIMTGKAPQQPKNLEGLRDLFKIATNLKDGNGDSVFYDLMTYDKDYWSTLGNVGTGQLGKVPKDLSARVSGSVATPFKILTDLSTLFAGGHVVDYKNDPIFGTTDTFAQKFSKMFQYEITGASPISASTFGQAQEKGETKIGSAISAIVGIRPTTSEKVKDIKAGRTDLFSLQGEKKNMQIHLDKIFQTNPQQAIKEAQDFNKAQKTKVLQIMKNTGIKSYNQSFFNRDYLVTGFKQKPPKTGSAGSVQSMFGK